MIFKTLSTVANEFFRYQRDQNKERQSEYEWLVNTSLLHSSSYLEELYMAAKGSKDKEDAILDHINKFAAYEVDSYKELEQKIAKKRWR
jgi:hypothetical protein